MDHADTAQLAAIVGALGAVLVLLARHRPALLAGFLVLAGAEAGLALSISGTDVVDALLSPAGGALLGAGALALAAVAVLLARRPALVPPVVLAAAPFRLPLDFDTSDGLVVSVAEDGQLGRLLPLYFVLGAAALALVWRAGRGGEPRAIPRAVALPAAAFVAFACVSLLWADDLDAGRDLLTFFTLPFAALVAVVARAPYPTWVTRIIATIAVVLAAIFAAIGLWQEVTRDLFFFSPGLEAANAKLSYFRVTSLFVDPSLYGRHLVLGLGVVLVLLALGRVRVAPAIALIALIWAGLFFSYSQSSMTALVAITLAVAAATGGRRVRRAVGIGVAALVVVAGALLVAALVGEDSLRRETSDRSQRVEDTARVVADHPIAGVGIGGQPRASRELSDRDKPTPDFVSHTTPLTVAAELGAIGLMLYGALLVGGATTIDAVRRRDLAVGLGLGVAFLALFVHALSYSGFLEDPITWAVLALGAGYLMWWRENEERAEAAPGDRAVATAP